MSTSLQAEIQFELVSGGQYPGFREGQGRWLTIEREGVDPIAVMWTNDNDGFGILWTNSDQDSEQRSEFEQWWDATYSTVLTLDWPATQVFNSLVTLENTVNGNVQEVQTGDLSDLDDLDVYVAEGSGPAEVREITAAGTTLVDDNEEEIRYGFTTDEDGKVLEVSMHDNKGIFLRRDREWEYIPADSEEEEYPEFFDQIYHDATEDIVEIFDNSSELTEEDLEDYVIV